MTRTLIAAAGFALAASCGLANAASWTVIVQPGVYGRVAIGGYAEPPQVYAPQPVMAVDNGYGQVVEEVVDPAYATDQPPVYLWVPEYQRRHWAQYCREYGAYGVPVYFVDDEWYRANVMRRNWTPEQRSWTSQQWAEQDRLARDRLERQRFEQQRYEQQQRWNNQRAWYGQQQQRQAADERARQGGDWDRERAQREAQNQIRPGSAQGLGFQQVQPQQPGNVARSGAYAQDSGGYAGPQSGSASQARGAGPAVVDRRGEERRHGRGEREDRRGGQEEGRAAFEHGRGGNRER
ncbi:MAG: hypothetical protein ACJ8GJ_23415 [Vitreoscilla sp.]